MDEIFWLSSNVKGCHFSFSSLWVLICLHPVHIFVTCLCTKQCELELPCRYIVSKITLVKLQFFFLKRACNYHLSQIVYEVSFWKIMHFGKKIVQLIQIPTLFASLSFSIQFFIILLLLFFIFIFKFFMSRKHG